MASSTSFGSCWESLPGDVLDMILEKLVPLSDRVRFSSVCKWWRSVAVDRFHQIDRWSSTLHCQQVPLLMVPAAADENNDMSGERRAFYDVTKKEDKGRNSDQMPMITLPFAERVCGSSHGWLVTNETTRVSLINPFSGAIIHLPPARRAQQRQINYYFPPEGHEDDEEYNGDNADDEEEEKAEMEDVIYPYYDDHPRPVDVADGLEDQEEVIYWDEDEWEPVAEEELSEDELCVEYRIHKAVLSKDPDLYPDDFEVMIIYGDMSRLAFLKSGDRDWTYLHNKCEQFRDLFYYRGKFYVLNIWSQLFWVEINNDLIRPRLKQITPKFKPYKGFRKCYLVESPKNGDLIMVDRFLGGPCTTTSQFEVLKLDFERGQWVKLPPNTLLGGASLFVGDNASVSAFASDFPGCLPNSIYFTDDHVEFQEYKSDYWKDTRQGISDIGIFDLKNKTFQKHFELDASQLHMPPPIWILPKLI